MSKSFVECGGAGEWISDVDLQLVLHLLVEALPDKGPASELKTQWAAVSRSGAMGWLDPELDGVVLQPELRREVIAAIEQVLRSPRVLTRQELKAARVGGPETFFGLDIDSRELAGSLNVVLGLLRTETNQGGS